MEALRADVADVKKALAAAEVREVNFFVEIRNEDDLRVSIAMGVPQNGWFIMENFIYMDHEQGYPYSGNHHIGVQLIILTGFNGNSVAVLRNGESSKFFNGHKWGLCDSTKQTLVILT